MVKHACLNCHKEYDCKIEDCPHQLEFGFCRPKCTEKYYKTHPLPTSLRNVNVYSKYPIKFQVLNEFLHTGKFNAIIKHLRKSANNVCIVATNQQRNKYPQDIRDQVFVMQIPKNWKPKGEI